MADTKRRIGIMGGTFDPVHNAHLTLAEQAYRQYSLDEIWMLPNGNPPHKRETRQAGMEHRMEMLRLAIREIPYLKLCDIERSGSEYHYTYETLQQLNRAYPDTVFYFIMGADSLFEFDSWKEPGIISRECTLLAAVRDHHQRPEIQARILELEERYGARIHMLDSPHMDIASEEIRRRVAIGEDISGMVPAAVAVYIGREHLYHMVTKQQEGKSKDKRVRMDTICIKDLKKELKKEMDDSRFEHTLGVMYTCAALAMRYGYDLEKAMLAGLMHDCAKCMPNAKKLKMAEKHHLEISDLERKNPFMLHAKLGAFLARKKYDIEDKEILDAIRWHTTGRPGMTMLDKIVYIADYIEPKRDKAPNLHEIRQLAFLDLDKTLLRILEDTLGYLGDSSEHVDSMTKKTYDFYKQQFS